MKQLFIISIFLMGVAVQAQVKKPSGPKHLHIRVLAKTYADSIVIRWAPMDAVAWLMGNDSGYRIARIDYSDQAHPVTTVLSAKLRPLTLEQMMATIGPNDKYAGVAAQALYGKDFQMTKEAPYGFAKKIKQAHDALNFRYSFTLEAADFSPATASAIALRWVDKDVRKGSSYIYVITVCGATKDYIVDSAATFVVDRAATPIPAPDGLQGFGFDRKSELHWNRRQLGNFSAYDIERSDDAGKNWVAMNKTPYLTPDKIPPVSGTMQRKSDTIVKKISALVRDHQVFMDSLPQDYHPYMYRVRGINAFAEWSPWSAPIEVAGRDLTPPVAPVIDSVRNTTGSQLRIVWSQRVSSPDLAGYYISKGNNVKGPFYPLTKYMLPKETRVFTDSAGVPHLPNYYVIVAVDTAKNVAASGAFPGYLTDTMPPAAPVRVAGSIDSMGVVRLHWAANREPDLKGYKVYFAYGARDEFTQVTHVLLGDTSFVDTVSMRSLNRRVWYSVVAVDNSNNHSAYSAPAMLKKLVVVPPSAPLAGAITVAARLVTIEWIESRSEGAAGYEIARVHTGAGSDAAGTGGRTAAKAAGASGGAAYVVVGKLAQDWRKRSLVFNDSVTANRDYYYAARTIDSTGVRSEWSAAVHAVYHATDSLAGPSALQARLDDKRRHIKLSWQFKDKGDYFFVVYRAVNHGALNAWQSFNKDVSSGEDDEAGSGGYDYAIKVVYRDRAAVSALSKPVHITIP
jgi:hypothetical protein